MLATFVIGLREGLEAALIVGIIAAFLRRNGSSLRPMWIGVTTAVLISIGVGVALQTIESALPQAGQEGMEAIIGLVAVVFVTGMIGWMRGHARGLKSELEHEASTALGRGKATALIGMAFLAVLKEGFETSVFLLATFQAAGSAVTAAIGAVLGILVAVAIGIGLYTGGIRLNLGRFFTATSVFLVFVAAGLVVSALRSAHEAGWILIGQQRTVDLSWLAPHGSVRAALITGVLGIPADPRVIEALAWALYLFPVLAIALWPSAWRLSDRRRTTGSLTAAGALTLGALALVIAVPGASDPAVPGTAALTGGGQVSVRLTDAGTAHERAEVTVATSGETKHYSLQRSVRVESTGPEADSTWAGGAESAGKRGMLALDRLIDLAGGRVPVGIDPVADPGPFSARWTTSRTVRAVTHGSALLDASARTRTIVTLSGGGLSTPRTIGLDDSTSHVPEAVVTARHERLVAAATAERERALWRVWLPVLMVIAAAVLAARGTGSARQSRRSSKDHAEANVAPQTESTEHQRREPHAIV